MPPYHLFVPQRLDRIECGGFPRGIKAKKNSDRGANEKCDHDRGGGYQRRPMSGQRDCFRSRDPDEWQEGRIPGAKNFSRGTVELEIEEAAPDLSTPIITHCGGGGRSALAAESLQRMGYTNVKSMAGGFKAWKAAGLPTTK